jgi:hypothetical protein
VRGPFDAEGETMNTKKLFSTIMTLLIALSFTACVTNGDYFKSETSWIRENETKQADVRMILGAPYSVGNSQGKPTWTYGFYRYKLFGKSYQKELRFFWNTDGTVSSFSFNSSFPEDIGASSGTKVVPEAKPKF